MIVTLADGIGSRFILPVWVSVTIDTMLIFGSDFDGYSDDNKCKRTWKRNILKTNLLYQNVDGQKMITGRL